jgi:thiazole synthase
VKVRVNGEIRNLPAGCTVQALLAELGIGGGQEGVAVAVNDEVVPRAGWATVFLSEDDRVEVVQAVQGGSDDKGGAVETIADSIRMIQPEGDVLQLGDWRLNSRLVLGSAKYPDLKTFRRAIVASGAEVVTVAIRRVDPKAGGEETVYSILKEEGIHVLPNTAGCYTAKDAILTAELARESLGVNWIKLEVLGDEKTLYPDPVGLLEAARELVGRGFTVLPYCNDDPVICKRLEDLGCPAVMPLAAPIGSGLGVRNPHNLIMAKEAVRVPMIVDAGVGTASDVAVAMELGVDGVLLNTAVACSGDPVKMAVAMRLAVQSGRLAYLAGRIPKREYAVSSSPTHGVPQAGTAKP